MYNNRSLVLTLNAEGKIDSANSDFTSVFGFTEEEIEGKYVNFLVADETEKSAALNFEHSPPVPVRAKMRTRWNTVLETKIIPAHDTHDLSGLRKLSITVLDEPIDEVYSLSGREVFQQIFEHAAVGVALVSSEGRILKANSAFQGYLGYSETELQHLTFQEFTHEDDVDIDVEYYRQLQAGEINNYQMEKRYITKYQQVFWVNLSVSLMRDAYGEMMYAIAVVQDIDKRKRAEIEVKTNQKRLEAAVKGAKEAVWHWLNVDSNEQWWSPAFYEILGYPLGSIEPLHTNFLDLLHEDDHHLFSEALQSHLSGDAVFDTNIRLRTRTGDYKWMNSRGVAQRKENGGTEMIGLIADIEVAKRTEELLQKRNQELENSNKELESFAYIASHDLQEPLRTIGSFLELFKESINVPLNEEASLNLEIIQNAALRMRSLINDLLEYSRVGRELTMERVDLNNLFEEVVLHLSAKIESKKGTIDIGSLPTLWGDKSSLYQLFNNLLTNSLTFTHPGVPPVIKVTAENEPSRVRVAVSDNGIGIDAAYQDKIFEIFKRLHTRDKYPGSGIGLAICKKVVDLHNGRISVSSSTKGTTFNIELPKQ